LDIATATSTFLNAGNRTFQQVPGGLPLEITVPRVVADFNGDGKDDVAISDEATISIWYSQGDGTFYQGTEILTGQEPAALVAGDFNGDGLPDIAAGLMWSQQVCLLFNKGQGQFARSFLASGANTDNMIAADLNHRGKLDLVITNFMLDYEPPNADVVFHQ
jgi:hypothetical protein